LCTAESGADSGGSGSSDIGITIVSGGKSDAP
jgi:hypothetical protein